MNTNQLCAWLLGLGLCLGLTTGPSLAASSPPISVGERVPYRLADSDLDGVDDANDLCPGTPTGTVVNAYGCPMSLTICDYTTATVTLKSTGGATGSTTQYVLAGNTGLIQQISATPSFTGLSGTATYMALALTYDGAVSNLAVGSSLSAVSASCLDWSDALVFKACVSVDSDLDGIPDATDLCPGTPVGTVVNAYGCALNLATCDYTTSTVTLTPQGGSTGTGISTRYVLASNTGAILQVSSTPSFSGLTGTATYMALALTYDGSVSNLTAGSALSTVSAACLDWSDALVFKACIIPPTTCDYQVGDIIYLKSTGGSAGAGVKTSYVLTDGAGKLVRINSIPSFSSIGLSAGNYRAYALTYTDDASITNLVVDGHSTLSQVTASCLAQSSAYSLTLCGDCLTHCIPISIVRIRR